MARKAVQGYTEKSYYDNTRFSGILATTDPLNEGYFKHLVNFDIADTGMSMTPRKGFLTTSLRNGTNYIDLSKKSFMYKDGNTQQNIIFDFKADKGYIVDVNGYNVTDKAIPITKIIDNYDWNDVVEYLIKEHLGVKAFFESDVSVVRPFWDAATPQEIVDNPIVNTISELGHFEDQCPSESTLIELAHNYLMQDPDRYQLGDVVEILSDYLDTFTGDTVSCNVLYVILREHTVIVYDEEKYAEVLSYIKSNLKDALKSVNIIDASMITKTVLKVVYDDNTEPYEFFLEVYYRENSVNQYAGDTLVFSVVDTTQHPTYIPTERNIASPHSVIPNPMQNLYLMENRPPSHMSNVGAFLYFEDNGRYIINHAYKQKNYLITPHFDLSPAQITGGDENTKWAYRFDVVSTRNITGIEDTIFRSPWMSYQGPNIEPQPIINYNQDSVDILNANLDLRHYKGTTAVISLVPKSLNGVSVLSETWYDQGIDTPETQPITNINRANQLHDTWESSLQNIYSVKTFKEAVTKLNNDAYFHVKFMNTPSGSGFESERVERLDASVYKETSTATNYREHFLDANQVISMIDKGLFKDTGVTFKTYCLAHMQELRMHNPNTYAQGRLENPEIRYMWNFKDTSQDTPRMYSFLNENMYENSIEFYEYIDDKYVVGITTDRLKSSLPRLVESGWFERGYTLVFYLRPYRDDELTDKGVQELKMLRDTWTATAPFIVNNGMSTVQYGYDDLTVTYIPDKLIKEPHDIQLTKNYIVFNNDRLVLWRGNTVYMSEPGHYNYFKEENKKEFSERIVKVLQFKNILLVFTVQHLYAIYETEIQSMVADPEGKLVSTSSIVWAQQTVLYNIMASDKYADVIQVFNQMVLFYSEDGQMFMIKPNTMIDSETQFSLQYFNKSANDILLNYDLYINERLSNYNIDKQITKDQVKIKALLSVNFIKILYCVPGYITYMLIYDVINNRYTVYDTLTFTDVVDKLFVESGEMYLTTHNESLYFTFPYIEMYQQDNLVDMSITNNFKKIAISGLLDTGNLNLNNHLLKRFRELHVTFKNLSASKVLFNVETYLDDVVSHPFPFYDMRLEVREVGGVSYFVSVPKIKENDLLDLVDISQVSEVASNAFSALNNNLFEERNLLMDFAGYTSSKLLTNRTSILGMGKVFRMKMQYISKGAYKLQNFGIIYKERRV